jgi:hypothetical protein
VGGTKWERFSLSDSIHAKPTELSITVECGDLQGFLAHLQNLSRQTYVR